MSFYLTHSDCSRIFYLKPVSSISNFSIVDDQKDFKDVKYIFSYSIDNSTWSDWTDSISDFLTQIEQIQFQGIMIYVRIQLTLTSDRTQKYCYYELKDILVNNESSRPVSIEMVNTNSILNTTNGKNLFNPYRNTDQAKQLYDKMSKSISDIFGFECIYFRTEVDPDSSDVTYKLYKLSNVIEYKQLKIVIRGNELPDNKQRYAEFDIDFQDEMEIHIVKEVFEEVFGKVQPNGNDYLYLPLTDRMYEINTVYADKAFMNHAAFYKAMLVKYETRADRHSDEVFDKIDELIDLDYEYQEDQFEEEKAEAVKDYNMVKDDTERQNNISDSKVNSSGSNVVKWTYNFADRLPTASVLSYDINGVNKNVWSVIFWMKLTKASDEIFRLQNELGETIMSLKYVKNYQNLELSANAGSSPFKLITTSPQSTDLQLDTFYGVVVNYGHEGDVKFITCSVFNSEMTMVQEAADDNFEVLSFPKKLNFYGANHFANIRLSKTFTKKINIQNVLSDSIPSVKGYYLIDNAMPDFTEPKQQC